MSDVRLNIFQKYPIPGSDILTKLLTEEISSYKAVEMFAEYNITVNPRTIQRHITKLKPNGESTPKIKLVTPQQIKKKHTNTRSLVTIVEAELKAIENLDYDNIQEIEPVKILDKNMMKLELMLAATDSFDHLKIGSIIDLETKLAREIYKMRPTSVEPDHNLIFKKFDLVTEFIMLQHSEHPDLKQKWIDFIQEKQLE